LYETPTGLPIFGDVFSADWLFDAYLRGDAVALKPVTLSRGAGTAYAPARAEVARDLLLAHGQQCLGIVMADDCEIESMLTRRSRATSRVLFAGVAPWPVAPSEVNRTRAITAFRRHPLEPADGFQGGVVEFQRLFAVAAESMNAAPDRRVARLSAIARADLEVRWAAFSTRRGPRAHLDAAEKFARLVAADGERDRMEKIATGELAVGEDIKAGALAVAKALARAWDIEGRVMNDVADACERCDPSGESVTNVRDALLVLAESVSEAIDALEPLRTT
jgi:hypothetical protein